MPDYRFETHSPSTWSSRSARATSRPAAPTPPRRTVVVEGKHAEDVVVEQHGDSISVIEPGRGRIFGDNALRVDVVVPTAATRRSAPARADVQVEGRAGHAQLRSGSGDCTVETVEGHLLVETGSGDIRVDDVRGNLKVKSGSGDVEVGQAGGTSSVSTGSGDVTVETARGSDRRQDRQRRPRASAPRTTTRRSAPAAATSSIDLVHRGRLTVKGASGDVPIGVTAGVPVWTDITTVSGTIRSDLQGAGQPQEGQDHIEVRAKTVSGDIALSEV